MYTDTPSTGAASVTEHRHRSIGPGDIPSLPPLSRRMRDRPGLRRITVSDIRTSLLNVYPITRRGRGRAGQDPTHRPGTNRARLVERIRTPVDAPGLHRPGF